MKKLNFMNKKFGCETANPYDHYEMRLAKHAGLTSQLSVPIRSKGLSSQGDKNKCITNVMKMVYRYGGELLIGFVYRPNYGAVDYPSDFIRHAVWVTPEGNAVCITAQNYENPEDYRELKNSKGDRCVGFYPTGRYSYNKVVSMIEKKKGKLQWRNSAFSFDRSAFVTNSVRPDIGRFSDFKKVTKQSLCELIHKERAFDDAMWKFIFGVNRQKNHQFLQNAIPRFAE